METYAQTFCRRCLVITAGLAAWLVASDCLAVIAFRLPEVQVTANPSGPTTGTFDVSVTADASQICPSRSGHTMSTFPWGATR